MINVSIHVFALISVFAALGIACIFNVILSFVEGRKNSNIILDLNKVNNKKYMFALALTNDEHRTYRRPTRS